MKDEMGADLERDQEERIQQLVKIVSNNFYEVIELLDTGTAQHAAAAAIACSIMLGSYIELETKEAKKEYLQYIEEALELMSEDLASEEQACETKN